MTTVNIDINRLTATGHVSATATVRVTYVRGTATPVLVDGAAVTYPDRIEQEITGTAAMEVYETGPSMAAHWLITFPTGARLERVTAIPASGTIDFGDLADIDPASVTPTLDVLHAWEAIVGEVAGYTDTTLDSLAAAVTAASASSAAATAASGSASAAAGSATAAGASAGTASTAASAAQTARTGSETARTAAEDAASLALAGQFAGATVNVATDVDTFRTPGVYRFTGAATTSPNLPAQLSGVLTVTRVNGDTNVMQEYRPFSGTAVRRRGYYMRTAANSATAFDAWDFVSPVRFDTSAGRAAYIVDSVAQREQRIYGDTGWRDVTSLLDSAKWDYASSNFHVLMRRVGDNVQMVARLKTVGAVAAGDTFLTAPTGFRGPVPAPGAAPFSVGPVAAPTGVGHIRTAPFSVTGVLDFRSAIAATTEISFALSWLTTEAWPTTLPGAASGTIPNA
ncbi:hypothetical protein IC744_14000 [Microbacterium hominis]|uniref:pyocin knob domain-containing protein n=1 Tax=Microbacterium TaxID=33882 RepID=UPI00168B0D9B|nr:MULTISPECIES: pyocin knob domain-containing protein [Microbacterium]QOC24393.1 hypothetical protein IC745_08240 [Microbacterium hominis]QOC28471.1 hypothetical protein IC744_14000 [Microbacterium hominis]QYF96326.1 pyocin knob domain-containing protein [Microbacterium sp. PAMC21962]